MLRIIRPMQLAHFDLSGRWPGSTQVLTQIGVKRWQTLVYETLSIAMKDAAYCWF